MNLLILANCQAVALAKICEAIRSESGDPLFTVLPIKPTYEHTAEDRPYLEQCLRECDVLLYQPHVNSHSEWRTSDYWVSIAGDARTFSFQSLYFAGYNPELTYLRDKVGRHLNEGFVDYHDKRIVKLFLEGMSPEAIVARYERIQPLAKDVEEIYATTMEEMRRREAEQGLDIKVSHFVEENFRSERLFFTYNHPANAVLYEVVRQLLQKLGCSDLDIPPQPKELLRFDVFPIPDSVRETLGLTFDPDPDYLVQSKPYTREELVEKYVDIYRSKSEWVQFAAEKLVSEKWLNRKKVIVHIGQSKTGTTSFQAQAVSNRAALLRAGLLYPTTGLKFSNHAMVARHYQGIDRNPALIEELRQEIERSSAGCALLSCEGFEGLQAHQVEELLGDFGECEVYFYCLLRDRLQWAISMYFEYVKKAWLTMSFSELLSYSSLKRSWWRQVLARLRLGKRTFNIVRHFHNLLSDRDNIGDWRSLLARENFRLISMERAGMWESLISDFLLDIDVADVDKQESYNAGPSLLAVELGRRFYRDFGIGELDYAIAMKFMDLLEDRTAARGVRVGANTPLSNLDELAAFLREYLDDDVWLSRNFGFSRWLDADIASMAFKDEAELDRLYEELKPDIRLWFGEVAGAGAAGLKPASS